MNLDRKTVKNYFEDEKKVREYATHGGYNYFSRRREVFNMLKNVPFSKLADLGCGGGGYLDIKKEHQCLYFGLDFSDNMIKGAEARARELGISEGISFHSGSVEHTPYADRSFDLVLAIGLVEYFENPDRLLGEIRRILKPGGIVIMHSFVPNRYISSLWPLMRLKNMMLGRRNQVGHKKYTKRQLDELMGKHGFKLLDFAYSNFNFLPVTPIIDRVLERIRVRFSESLVKKGTKKFGFLADNYIGKYQLPA
ncbi:MAG: class I SAM-dependent methyltransferase [Chloroflexi bacterium]|nr:class I SAM-dependent methyltransferase [Chloroflexota bacterium]